VTARATDEQTTAMDAALAWLLSQPGSGVRHIPARVIRHAFRPDAQRGNRILGECVPSFLVKSDVASDAYYLTLDGLLSTRDPRPRRVIDAALTLIAQRYEQGNLSQRSLLWSDIKKNGGFRPTDFTLAWHTILIARIAQMGGRHGAAGRNESAPGHDYEFWLNEHDLEDIANHATQEQWTALQRARQAHGTSTPTPPAPKTPPVSSAMPTLKLHHAALLTELKDLLCTFLPATGAPRTFEHAAKAAGLEQAWQSGGTSKGPLVQTLLEASLATGRFEPFVNEVVKLALGYRRFKKRPLRRDEIATLADLAEQLEHPLPQLREPRFLSTLAPASIPWHGPPPPPTAPSAPPPSPTPTILPVDDKTARIRAAALDAMLATFRELSTLENRQAAGQALNGLLASLFGHFDLHPTETFRVVGEEIDGGFVFNGDSYLVEAKWTKDKIAIQPLDSFDSKVARKSHYTRGLFVSINGYSEEALAAYEKGCPRSALIDGAHLYRVLSGAIPLPDLLSAVFRIFTQRGTPYVPVSLL
jgi:hypothetical protein